MYAFSARHCGPHSSSIKQSILNWHDRLLKGRICKVMWRTGKGNGAHTIKLTVIQTRTAISSSRSQQISIIRKDGARTIIVLAIRMTNVFIKELVNLRTVLLLMVKTVETSRFSLLTVPLLAGMQSFAVNVKGENNYNEKATTSGTPHHLTLGSQLRCVISHYFRKLTAFNSWWIQDRQSISLIQS